MKEGRGGVQYPEERYLNQEESQQLLNLKFESVEKYPDMAMVARIVNQELNIFRRRFHLPALTLEADDIRLIAEQDYDSNSAARRDGESGSFFHNSNRKLFIKDISSKPLTSWKKLVRGNNEQRLAPWKFGIEKLFFWKKSWPKRERISRGRLKKQLIP